MKHFVLNEQEWAEFNRRLAEPTKPNERLRKLLTEPSLLDAEAAVQQALEESGI